MAVILAVYSMKGGVGKTTLAVNLAYCAAARSGLRTLLWDVDAQGAASYLCAEEQPRALAKRMFLREIEPQALVTPTRWPQLDLLAADLSLRHLDQTLSDLKKPKRLRRILQTLSPNHDLIVLDLPPGLGELSDQLFRAADIIVVPVVPTPLAMRTLALVEDHLGRNHDHRPVLMPVISMADRRRKLHRAFIEEHPQWPVIPQASVVERMAVERSPLLAFAGRSPAAMAIAGLWDEIDRKLASLSKVG